MTGGPTTVAITGASSGFCEGASRAFADRGYRVWGTMRGTSGRTAGKKAALKAYPPQISIVEMDVTDDTSVANGFAPLLAEGGVDILINNDGIMCIGLTEVYCVAQARAQMNTNYFRTIRAMQAVLPSMRKAGSGLIINTSSLASRVSVPFFTCSATTHALESYSQILRYEVAPFGIDVALVEPGLFPSDHLATGQPPARACNLESHGDLKDMPAQIASGFADMLDGDQPPDPQLGIDAYFALADAGPGNGSTRTIVGITRGVDAMNAFTQPRQDALLKEMKLDAVLGSADA